MSEVLPNVAAVARESNNDPAGKSASPDPAAEPRYSSATNGDYFSLLQAVATDKSIDPEARIKLVTLLKGTTPTSDRLTYRLAIALIGLIAIAAIAAIWSLLYLSHGTDVPDGLIAIASGAVGGLAGLLSPSRAAEARP